MNLKHCAPLNVSGQMNRDAMGGSLNSHREYGNLEGGPKCSCVDIKLDFGEAGLKVGPN
jgi:hypothetical protein